MFEKVVRESTPLAEQKSVTLLTYMILGVIVFISFQEVAIQLALPKLSAFYDVSYSTLSIVVTVYWLTYGVFSIPLGKMGDVYTHKRVFLIALGIFCLLSVFCALSKSWIILAIFRALQGICVAALTSNGVSLLRTIHPEEKRGHVTGLWSATISLSFIIGPSFEGVIIEYFGWEYIFVIEGFVGGLILLGLIWLLPKSPHLQVDFDYIGSFLLALLMTSLILILSPIHDEGTNNLELAALIIVALITFVVFITYENRIEMPLIRFTMFKHQPFTLGLICGMAYAATIQGLNYLLQYYLQNDLKFSSSESGTLWMVMSIATLIATVAIGRLSDYYGSRRLVIYGTILRFIAFALLTYITYVGTFMNIAILVFILVIFGFGLGITAAPLYSLVIGSFPQSDTGITSGMYITARTLSGSLGIVLFSQLLIVPSLGIESDLVTSSELFIPFLIATAITLIGLLSVWAIPQTVQP